MAKYIPTSLLLFMFLLSWCICANGAGNETLLEPLHINGNSNVILNARVTTKSLHHLKDLAEIIMKIAAHPAGKFGGNNASINSGRSCGQRAKGPQRRICNRKQRSTVDYLGCVRQQIFSRNPLLRGITELINNHVKRPSRKSELLGQIKKTVINNEVKFIIDEANDHVKAAIEPDVKQISESIDRVIVLSGTANAGLGETLKETKKDLEEAVYETSWTNKSKVIFQLPKIAKISNSAEDEVTRFMKIFGNGETCVVSFLRWLFQNRNETSMLSELQVELEHLKALLVGFQMRLAKFS